MPLPNIQQPVHWSCPPIEKPVPSRSSLSSPEIIIILIASTVDDFVLYLQRQTSEIRLCLKMSKNRQFLVSIKNSAHALENSLAVPQKATHRVATWSSNSMTRYIYSRKWKYTSSQASNVNLSKSGKHHSINWWMSKWNVVSVYNGTLMGHRKWATRSMMQLE